jgi:hypothetical protein
MRLVHGSWLVVALTACNALLGIDDGRMDSDAGGDGTVEDGPHSAGSAGASSTGGRGDAAGDAAAGAAAGSTSEGSGGASSDAGSSTYRDVVLSDGPVAYWRLGEPSGTIAKDELGLHDGVYLGQVRLGVAGAIAGDSDTAVQFESGSVSVGDFFDFPDGAPFSLEVWALLPDPVGPDEERYLISKFGSLGGYHLYANASRNLALDLGTAENDDWATVEAAFAPLNEYRHAVVTFDGAWGRIYVNGIQHTARSFTNSVADTPESLRIGHSDYFSYENSYYQGALDEVAIYDYALAADQVSAHFTAGR